jgi:hypothetical protein
MSRHASALFGAILAVATGCDRQSTNLTMTTQPHPIRAEVPAVDFRLTPAQRERLMPGFGVLALERLLAHVVPERRSEILSYFEKPEPNAPRRGMLAQIKDPELQPLLEEVWAPVWDHAEVSDAELQKNEMHLPGRDLAIQRRAQARSAKRPQ